jgi:adenylosuccinate synthase
MIADVIVDLQYGDCGKGKITHYLCSTGKYTHVVRYNGGCNAGHTIYHNGEKFVTHHIPAGVFFGIKSIIGPGCVVNPEQFFKEIKELEAGGLEVRNLVKIAKNTHIITRSHLSDDSGDTKIRNVWGVAKAYETYVGTKKFQGDDPIFDEICEVGQEYGATTGRKRQVNWMSWNLVDKAIKVNGVTHLVFNKMDVLREVGTWKALQSDEIQKFDTENEFQDFVLGKLSETGISVYFSGDKARI